MATGQMPDALLVPFRDAPREAGIFVDFDGTLSIIVDDPAAAVPFDGAADLLAELAKRYKRVGVLSGRPVSFLHSMLPGSILLAGLYGLEVVDRGKRRDHPSAGAWREVIDDVAAAALVQGPVGMRTEHKGLSLTLHYREHPEVATEVYDWAARAANRSGLEVRSARMSVELHPPIAADKGTAILQLAKNLAAVCFIGDDLGDLPGFDSLDALAAEGREVLRVAVRSDEAPVELLDRADAIVDGPAGVVGLLQRL